MKKVASIFLLSLYLGSLSGLAWATDCKSFGLSKVSVYETTVCLGSNDHSGNKHQHPLQQFCKVIEVHKEVLISKSKSHLPYFNLSVIHTSNFSLANNNSYTSYVGNPLLVGRNKLFLRHRQILI